MKCRHAARKTASPLKKPIKVTLGALRITNVLRTYSEKDWRSIAPIRAMMFAYAFSFSVNTVASGAVTEATNLSIGIVDEDGSQLSRQIAEAFVPPVPAGGANPFDRDRPGNGPGKTFSWIPQLRGRRSRAAKDIRPGERGRDGDHQAGNRQPLHQECHHQRGPEIHLGARGQNGWPMISSFARSSIQTSGRPGFPR